jgi:NAD(P)H-hydrate repair Nnr-like enzyme with NAD(P)H-hydrate epimerase domain
LASLFTIQAGRGVGAGDGVVCAAALAAKDVRAKTARSLLT